MSANDRDLDLSFLSGEEADFVREVLERDRWLKTREEERVRKLQETRAVGHWLKAGSGKGAKDFLSSVRHLPQQSLSVNIKGKSCTELPIRPRGLLGKWRDAQSAPAVQNSSSLRTRLTSLFTFKFPQQKGNVDQGIVREGCVDSCSGPPPDAGRPGCVLTGVSCEVSSNEGETPSLDREEICPDKEQGRFIATGDDRNQPAEQGPTGQHDGELGLGTGGEQHYSVHHLSSKQKEESKSDDGEPPELLSGLSHLPPNSMLSSALVRALTPPWSGRFQRHKAEPGGAVAPKELRQENGEWARFLKPHRPFTTVAVSHPFPGGERHDGDYMEALHGPDCRATAPTRSRPSSAAWSTRNAAPCCKPDSPLKGTAGKSVETLDNRGMAGTVLLTPPETPSPVSSRPLDHHGYRRLSQTGSPDSPNPRFGDASSPLSSKPTTSSLLLSLRRLGSTRRSRCNGPPLTPPPSPANPVLPAPRSVTLETPGLSIERRRATSVREGQLPPSPVRKGRRELTDWLDFLNAQSLMRKNTLYSSACKKRGQQDNDPITPSNILVSTANTVTATKHNLFSSSNSTISLDHNLNSHNTHNSNLNVLNAYNSVKTNTLNSPNTTRSPNTFNSYKNLNNPYSINSPNTSIDPKITTTPKTFNKSPNTPNTPISPNTPVRPYSNIAPNIPVSLSTTFTPDILSTVNSPNQYKNINNPYTINSPKTSISPTNINGPPYALSTLNNSRRSWLSSSRAQSDRTDTNCLTPSHKEGTTPPHAQQETAAGEGRSRSELPRGHSPTHCPSLGRLPHTMEGPTIFSSLRKSGPSERSTEGRDPKVSPDLDQTLIPWRCHIFMGQDTANRFTFDNAKDPCSVKLQSQSTQRNTPILSPHWVTPVSALSATCPLYSRDTESPSSIHPPSNGPGSHDRLWALPMDTGDLTSPNPLEPQSDMRGNSPPELVSIPANLQDVGDQFQGDVPTHRRTSRSMFSFTPETNFQLPASGVGIDTGMGTGGPSALQSPPQRLTSTDYFSQSLTNPTNQDSAGISGSSRNYMRSPQPPTYSNPTDRGADAFITKAKGIVGNKQRDSVVEEHSPATSLKHQYAKRSPLMFRRRQDKLAPPGPGVKFTAPTPNGTGKVLVEGGKGGHKVDMGLSQIKMTFSSKCFEDDFLNTRKKSKKTLPLEISGSSHVVKGDRAGGPGGWQGAGVLRPLDHENKTKSGELGRQCSDAQVMRPPAASAQLGHVWPDTHAVDGGWCNLRDDNGNPAYPRYATVPGRVRRRGASQFPLDFDPEDAENENVFFDTRAAGPRTGRINSTSFCEPKDVRGAIVAHSNSARSPKAAQRVPVRSPSPSGVFGLRHGRSFSVSSVHVSRPSGCSRISTAPRMSSAHDLRTSSVDVATAGDLWDSGSSHLGRLSCSLDQNVFLKRIWGSHSPELPPALLLTPPGSPRPTRRISSSPTTSRTSQDSTSPKGRLPSRGYRSSLSVFEESDSDTTTDDEYYLSSDKGERETAL